MSEASDNSVDWSFKKLNLNDWIIKQCASIGLTSPTPIQQHCIPPILDGRDCLGCAKTGSGKTLAFAIPILQKLCEDPYGIFALVLTPTRELAFQIAEQFRLIGKPIGVRECVVVGGVAMVTQGQELQAGPHIVIASPGRLADHLESCNTFSLKKIKFLVLDEADRLLEGNFDDQLKVIFDALPAKRQTLLFSATITDTLTKLQEVAHNKPFLYDCKESVATVDQLIQEYVLCPLDVKDGYLVQVVQKFREKNQQGSVIIFTGTCRLCQLLSLTLNELGFQNMALHSMISQKQRLASLNQFKSNSVRILVATDVASRGLDIPTVELIVNYNVPSVAKDYVHRVGRTARAGRGGRAMTLVTQHDINLVHAIEDLIGTKLIEHKVNDKEVLEILTQVSVTRRESEMKMEDGNFFEKKEIYRRKNYIIEGKDPDEEEQRVKQALKRKMKQNRRANEKKKRQKQRTNT